MNEIPIKNIYYMALYAWEKIANKLKVSKKSIEQLDNINEIIVELFLVEVSRIAKKGKYGEYIEDNHYTKYIKGKIDIQESIKLTKPNLICSYDEFCKDNIFNQVVKSVLIRISRVSNINQDLKKKGRLLLLEFSEVEEIVFCTNISKQLIYNKLNIDYKFAIDLGLLIYGNSIPSEQQGNYIFIDILKNDEQMSIIFETFLRSFYKNHSNYKVNSRRYDWDLTPIGNSNMSLLPKMETDIELVKNNKKIIIDAKYYQNALSYRFESKKFISSHLYQISAYINKNIAFYDSIRGILMYPSNGYNFHEKYISPQGYTIEIKTVDLSKDWDYIKKDLILALEDNQ